MGLFELLIIIVFIVLPIIDGIQKQREKPQGPAGKERGGGQPGRPGREREEPQSAADMVPSDLWEILTGEKPPPGPGRAGTQTGTPAGTDDAWLDGPEDEPDPVAEWSEPEDDWRSDRREPDAGAEPEPASLEYEGPEAYTLETPAPPPLERPVPSAEARHREFHALIDGSEEDRAARTSPLIRSLRSREGLRQAVLFKEILGKPKGLE